MHPDLSPYYSGEKLYGDDFSAEQLAEWYEDEREGYADLGPKDRTTYAYGYHALNTRHCFDHLPSALQFEAALGLGSAYGDEFEPLLGRVKNITLVDPSDAFDTNHVKGTPVQRVKPAVSGDLPFEDDQFDLVLCFGVLHHIANVSHVVSELARCTKPGGYALIREPITTMGDWRKPRPGCTKRERGIPHHLFKSLIARSGYRVEHSSLCVFPPVVRLCKRVKMPTYSSRAVTLVDDVCSRVFAWNARYYRPKLRQKFAPSCVAWVLRK